jgi:hypothetical protein
MTTVIGSFGLPEDWGVAHYDADGHLIGRVTHLDGEFVEPITLEPGESLWTIRPGGLPRLPCHGGGLSQPELLPLMFAEH